MNQMRPLVAAAAALAAQGIWIQSSAARDLYRADVDTVGVYTNRLGEFVCREFGNDEIIRETAAAAGITNLEKLRLVYSVTNDALEVVTGTNSLVVATPLSFAGGTTLMNTNATRVERLSFVYQAGGTNACGTLLAGEDVIPETTNHPGFFNLTGQLQFALPSDDGTNSPVIFTGSLSAGEDRFEPFDRR